jgi:hypothetical protein
VELPNRAVSLLVFWTYVLLIGAGVWTAVERGPVTAYIAFAWLNPLTTALWFKFEYELFCGADINEYIIYLLLATGFLAGVVCLPVITVVAWGSVSPLVWAGILAASLMHSVPFLIYALFTISFHNSRRKGRRK